MTRRHDLELAVIEQARSVAACNMLHGLYEEDQLTDAKWADVVRLQRALGELDKLRQVEKPRASAVAPVTSHEAAAWAAKSQKAVNRRILRFMHDRPVSGATVDEIMYVLQGSHQTISARVNELVNAFWLVDTRERRETRSGAQAIVWKLSSTARYVMDRLTYG
jgi:hypothetical protein